MKALQITSATPSYDAQTGKFSVSVKGSFDEIEVVQIVETHLEQMPSVHETIVAVVDAMNMMNRQWTLPIVECTKSDQEVDDA